MMRKVIGWAIYLGVMAFYACIPALVLGALVSLVNGDAGMVVAIAVFGYYYQSMWQRGREIRRKK